MADVDFNVGDLIRGPGGIYRVVSGEGNVLYVQSLVGQYKLIDGSDYVITSIGELYRNSRP